MGNKLCMKVLVTQSCLTLCDPTRLLCPWDSPGKIAGVGFHSFLQGNLPHPGIKPRSPECRRFLYWLSHQGSPGDKLQVSCSRTAKKEHLYIEGKGGGMILVNKDCMAFYWLSPCKEGGVFLPVGPWYHPRMWELPFLISQLCLTEFCVC